MLNEDELQHLGAIHEELQIASNNFVLKADLAQKLQPEFARRPGRIIPAMRWATAMINRRKSSALATLKAKSDDQDLGFSEIREVGT